VTPDNERQAWREAVRSFRLAATMLKNPAPGLFAGIAIPEEALRNLTEELPLVSFSPFGALPGDIAYGRGEPPHRPASRPSGRITEHQATRPVAQESTVQPPVFSFRQSSASDVPTGQRQPPRSAQGAPEDSTGTGSAKERFRVSELKVREESAAVETGPDVSVHSRTTTDGHDIEMEHGAGYRSVYPMTLLNSLAEGVLGTVEQGTPDVPIRRADMPGSVPLDGRMVRPREPDRKARHDHGADDHTPTEPASPSLLPPARSRGPDISVPISGNLPAFDPEAHGNSAIALIDSLAELVLAPEARIDESLPASGARGGGATAPVTARAWEQSGEEADLYLFALSDGAEGEGADQNPSGIAEETFPRRMDAEAFAALVNDVLVRQARRHGVDLS
jgi:hypothetical protein